MGEKAEAGSAASLRSGRGLYLSTLTLSLLRGTSAIIAAAQRPIRAQLCGSHSHMHQAGEWLTIRPRGNGGLCFDSRRLPLRDTLRPRQKTCQLFKIWRQQSCRTPPRSFLKLWLFFCWCVKSDGAVERSTTSNLKWLEKIALSLLWCWALCLLIQRCWDNSLMLELRKHLVSFHL